MDLFDVVRACFRRWYVTLPLMMIAGWFAISNYKSVAPVYYSSTVIGLTGPSTQVVWDQVSLPRNGLLETGGPSLIANLVILGLRDPEIVNRVVQGGGKRNYNTYLFPVTGNAVPLITIDTTQADSDSALRTVSLAAAQVDSVLSTVQRSAGVSEPMMVRAIQASPPYTPRAGVPSRTRATISILAAGLGIAVTLSVLADVALSRLSAARRTKNLPPVLDAQTRTSPPPGVQLSTPPPRG